MKTITTDLRSAAIISFILVLPFAILESLFNTVNKQNASGLTDRADRRVGLPLERTARALAPERVLRRAVRRLGVLERVSPRSVRP